MNRKWTLDGQNVLEMISELFWYGSSSVSATEKGDRQNTQRHNFIYRYILYYTAYKFDHHFDPLHNLVTRRMRVSRENSAFCHRRCPHSDVCVCYDGQSPVQCCLLMYVWIMRCVGDIALASEMFSIVSMSISARTDNERMCCMAAWILICGIMNLMENLEYSVLTGGNESWKYYYWAWRMPALYTACELLHLANEAEEMFTMMHSLISNYMTQRPLFFI